MNREIMILLLVFVIIIGAFPVIADAARFSDVSNHWALQYINWAADNGSVNGYPDGTFKPEGNMTRAEFVKILNRFACAKEKADIRFDDVNTSDWYYDEVRIAVRHGYVTNGGSFRGNDAITRDDVMRMLAYVYKLTGDTTLVDKFTDGKDVISKSAVSALVNKGVVNGYPDGTIRPLRSIKRAEIAKLFHVARTILGAPELCKSQPYYPIWGGGTGTGGTWKPTSNPNPYNCPTDAALRSAFSSAVGTALGNFKGLDNIAKIDYNINTRISTVTILNNEASAGAIANTGAMTELKKLVDEKGLISYQIPGQPVRTLTGATVQQMKEWIVEDFGAALDLTSIKLGDLIGKSVSATVRFRSTRSECPRIVSDLYKVNFVEMIKEKRRIIKVEAGKEGSLINSKNATFEVLSTSSDKEIKVKAKELVQANENYIINEVIVKGDIAKVSFKKDENKWIKISFQMPTGVESLKGETIEFDALKTKTLSEQGIRIPQHKVHTVPEGQKIIWKVDLSQRVSENTVYTALIEKDENQYRTIRVVTGVNGSLINNSINEFEVLKTESEENIINSAKSLVKVNKNYQIDELKLIDGTVHVSFCKDPVKWVKVTFKSATGTVFYNSSALAKKEISFVKGSFLGKNLFTYNTRRKADTFVKFQLPDGKELLSETVFNEDTDISVIVSRKFKLKIMDLENQLDIYPKGEKTFNIEFKIGETPKLTKEEVENIINPYKISGADENYTLKIPSRTTDEEFATIKVQLKN